jgi:hypothetical protein
MVRAPRESRRRENTVTVFVQILEIYVMAQFGTLTVKKEA